MLIDAHNHLQDSRFGEDLPTIIDSLAQHQIEHCIVNGTCEDDWQRVIDLHHQHPMLLSPACGLHPWKTATRSTRWLEKLTDLLERNPHVSIGECGLDGWIRDADLQDQCDVLVSHFALSRNYDRPLTIHCLKAWPQLLEMLRGTPPLPPFLLHSFGGPAQMIPELCRLGAHFSFSGYFLHPRKHQALQNFRLIPHDRLHLETDAPDMAPPLSYQGILVHHAYNHPVILARLVDELAALRNINRDECAALTSNNSRRLFRLSPLR
jgi:TatD DNase family protein